MAFEVVTNAIPVIKYVYQQVYIRSIYDKVLYVFNDREQIDYKVL